MASGIEAGLLFIIDTIFDLYLYVLIARLVLAYYGANFYEPITQFVGRLTDFIVNPVRRVVPNRGRIEFASIFVIFAIEVIKFLLICTLTFRFPNLIGVLLLVIVDMIRLLIQAYFYAIFFQAVLSWVGMPVHRVLAAFTAPLLKPARRFIKPISGFDLSPIPVLILLQLFIIVVTNPLISLSLSVAISS